MSGEGLAGVLAAHFSPMTCVREHGMPGDEPMVAAHTTHVAAAVLDWLRSVAADEGVRECHATRPARPPAALTAFVAALGDAETGREEDGE